MANMYTNIVGQMMATPQKHCSMPLSVKEDGPHRAHKMVNCPK